MLEAEGTKDKTDPTLGLLLRGEDGSSGWEGTLRGQRSGVSACFFFAGGILRTSELFTHVHKLGASP